MHDPALGRDRRTAVVRRTRRARPCRVWDGTPIDVAVAFPAASGEDNNYPVVGIYHGWGGTKITPSSAARSAG